MTGEHLLFFQAYQAEHPGLLITRVIMSEIEMFKANDGQSKQQKQVLLPDQLNQIRDKIESTTAEYLKHGMPDVSVKAIDKRSNEIRQLCTDSRIHSLRIYANHVHRIQGLY